MEIIGADGSPIVWWDGVALKSRELESDVESFLSGGVLRSVNVEMNGHCLHQHAHPSKNGTGFESPLGSIFY